MVLELTSPDQANQAGLARFLSVVVRQWWVVAVCVILAAAGCGLYLHSTAAKYRSYAVVSIANPSTADTNGATTTSGPDPLTEVREAAILTAAAAAAHLPAGAVTLSASVDTNADTVTIGATASDTTQAAAAANGAAAAFAHVRVSDLAQLGTALQPELNHIQAQITALQGEGATQPTANNPGPNSTLNAELAGFTSTYQTLFQQQQTFALAGANVTVATKATAAEASVVGNRHRVIELALVAGLLAGCGIGLVREQLDDKIRSATDVADFEGVNVLTRLPLSSAVGPTGTIADTPGDELAEAIRELRTALRFISVERPLATILITSSTAGEGKSLVAANLAVALAMSGVKTILVSSDLRAPTLETRFAIARPGRGLSDAIADAAFSSRSQKKRDVDLTSPSPGSAAAIPSSAPLATELVHQWTTPEVASPTSAELLELIRSSDFRSGRVRVAPEETNGHGPRPVDHQAPEPPAAPSTVDDLLVETGVPGLLLLPAGPAPPNPAELLGSPQFDELLSEIHRRAEMVVLDSPPLLAVTDALVLTSHADGIVFVVAEGITSRSAARRSLLMLKSAPAPVMGFVVNRSSRTDVAPYYGVTAAPRRWRRSPPLTPPTSPDGGPHEADGPEGTLTR